MEIQKIVKTLIEPKKPTTECHENEANPSKGIELQPSSMHEGDNLPDI
jgi:hypothetical protein